jgi:hypothetical protein
MVGRGFMLFNNASGECGAQKLIGDLQDSEIARFFVVFPGPAESPLAFLIERFIA